MFRKLVATTATRPGLDPRQPVGRRGGDPARQLVGLIQPPHPVDNRWLDVNREPAYLFRPR